MCKFIISRALWVLQPKYGPPSRVIERLRKQRDNDNVARRMRIARTDRRYWRPNAQPNDFHGKVEASTTRGAKCGNVSRPGETRRTGLRNQKSEDSSTANDEKMAGGRNLLKKGAVNAREKEKGCHMPSSDEPNAEAKHLITKLTFNSKEPIWRAIGSPVDRCPRCMAKFAFRFCRKCNQNIVFLDTVTGFEKEESVCDDDESSEIAFCFANWAKDKSDHQIQYGLRVYNKPERKLSLRSGRDFKFSQTNLSFFFFFFSRDRPSPSE